MKKAGDPAGYRVKRRQAALKDLIKSFRDLFAFSRRWAVGRGLAMTRSFERYT